MDSRFFPHYTGGQYNPDETKTFFFNINPNAAIALDPRYIISEWSEESRISISRDDIYAGMQLYCLADKCVRVCRWIPSAGTYTGNDCIWDILHSDNELVDSWVDVTTLNPVDVKTLDERIEEAESKEWRYSMNATASKWGFYKVETLDDTTINNILNVIAIHSAADDLDYIAGNLSSMQTKPGTSGSKTVTIKPTAYVGSTTAIEQASDCNLVFVVPSHNRTTDAEKRAISALKVGSDVELSTPVTKTLQCIDSTDYKLHDQLFDIYVTTQTFDEATITQLTTGEASIIATFTK